MLILVRDRKSPNWYIRGTIAGQRIYKSTGTPDRAQAEAYRRKRDAEFFNALALGVEQPATWSQAVIVYLQKGGSDRYLAPLLERWKGKTLPQITQREVDDTARQLYPTAKPATLVRQLYGPVVSALRAAKHAELPGSFVPLFQKPRVKREPVRYATDDHLRGLLVHCSGNVAAAILLMSFTGLRTGEVLRLQKADFEIRPGWVFVAKTKSGEPAMVPLPDGWSYPEGGFGFTTAQGFNKALRRAAKAAGLPYLSGHKIGRHAFAARLLNAGYDIQTVKEAGRWKTMAVVSQVYGHLQQRHVHQAMRDVWLKAGGMIEAGAEKMSRTRLMEEPARPKSRVTTQKTSKENNHLTDESRSIPAENRRNVPKTGRKAG